MRARVHIEINPYFAPTAAKSLLPSLHQPSTLTFKPYIPWLYSDRPLVSFFKGWACHLKVFIFRRRSWTGRSRAAARSRTWPGWPRASSTRTSLGRAGDQGDHQRQSSYLSEYHQIYLWRKNCHVEKFQLSIQNLNNLWSFIEVYATFVPNLCGEKSVRRKSVWRKNDKYEVWIKITQEGTTWKMSSIKTMLFLKGAFTSRKVGFTGHVWQKIIATIIWDKIMTIIIPFSLRERQDP